MDYTRTIYPNCRHLVHLYSTYIFSLKNISFLKNKFSSLCYTSVYHTTISSLIRSFFPFSCGTLEENSRVQESTGFPFDERRRVEYILPKKALHQRAISTLCTYIYIYIYVCYVCVCVQAVRQNSP